MKKRIQSLIEEMEHEDQQARDRLAERKAFYKDKKLISIISVTRSGLSGELVLTERSILDEVITEHKNKGRIVLLPYDEEIDRDCWGLCSIRCMKFKDNCRKCIKNFYEAE